MRSKPSITMRLPRDLNAFLLRQVDAGGFGTPSEYIRHLLRKAQVASTVDEIDAKLIAAEASGRSFHPTAKHWAALARRADRRVAEIRARKRATRRRSA